MISKNDLILLLTEMQSDGIDVSEHLRKTIKSQEIQFDVVKFINDNRQFDLQKFYEKIRKSYNDKHSKLYKNIVRDTDDIQTIVTTLSALATQILIFAENVEDKEMFFRHARLREIYQVLYKYACEQDSTKCIDLVRLIKSDLKIFEQMK